MHKYNTYFKKISDLTNSECQAMADLYLSHYDASNEGRFKPEQVCNLLRHVSVLSRSRFATCSATFLF
jgi:hypothetical protein